METKKNQEFFKETEERYLREHFKKLDTSLGIQSETPQSLQILFDQKLAALDKKKLPSLLNWRLYGGSVIGAFSIGILCARLLVPVDFATRGGGIEIANNTANESFAAVLEDSDPENLVISAIAAAFESDIEITTFKDGDRIQISLKPLRPFSVEQSKVKKILNIKEDVSGEITILVQYKK